MALSIHVLYRSTITQLAPPTLVTVAYNPMLFNIETRLSVASSVQINCSFVLSMFKRRGLAFAQRVR